MSKKITGCLLFITAWTGTLNAGSSGLPFLRQGIGAHAQAMGNAFGNYYVRAFEPGEKEQAERAFTPLAADAIGGKERHQNPNRAEQGEVQACKEPAAQFRTKTLL